MRPVVTPAEMAMVDAQAPEPLDVLVRRAGTAVAWAARRLLGGTYGRRVVVIAGKGNNGADGRVAADVLRRWGVAVVEMGADGSVAVPQCDLLIDAAYGTGLRRPYVAPTTSAPVLAVDIPSGVDGLTGAVAGQPLPAVATVTFQALKPGLLFHPGAGLCGAVTVADIGLDIGESRTGVVEAGDVAAWIPPVPVDAHKWKSACWVIGGSAGMTGAPTLAAAAAARVGAGYVRVSVPGGTAPGPIEAVHHDLPQDGWERGLSTDLQRFSAAVVGPGLGRSEATASSVRGSLTAVDVPLVLDGDGLAALDGSRMALDLREAPTVLTPHDREYAYLVGSEPGPDRIAAARSLAAAAGAVVVLKGPATVIAGPDGRVAVSTTGDQRLATAGTGDVLAGIIGGLLARNVPPFEAAAAGAWLHGTAARHCPEPMVASDLLTHIPEALDATHLG